MEEAGSVRIEAQLTLLVGNVILLSDNIGLKKRSRAAFGKRLKYEEEQSRLAELRDGLHVIVRYNYFTS